MIWGLFLHGCQCGDGVGLGIDEQLAVRRLQVVAGKWMLTMMLGVLGVQVIFSSQKKGASAQTRNALSQAKKGLLQLFAATCH